MSRQATLAPSLVTLGALVLFRLLLGVPPTVGALLLLATGLTLLFSLRTEGPRGGALAVALGTFALLGIRGTGLPLGSLLLLGMAASCLLAAGPSSPRAWLLAAPIALLIVLAEILPA